MTIIHPPRHIVWSTDAVDLDDPFQRRWYLRQILTHGGAEDIQTLELEEVERELENLDLPPEIFSLWNRFLKNNHANR